MELWFTERHTNGVNFSIKVDCQLFSGQSEFQKIDIFDSKDRTKFFDYIIPVVPEQGSVGASGDLAPLAHLVLPLLGLGKVWEKTGEKHDFSLF